MSKDRKDVNVMVVLTSSACANDGLAILFLVLGVISFVLIMLAADADKNVFCAICCVCFLAMFAMSALTGGGAIFRHTDLYDYTVELDSTSDYQWLIENNYKINKRVYDSKEIYNITGAPLPDEDWIIYPD